MQVRWIWYLLLLILHISLFVDSPSTLATIALYSIKFFFFCINTHKLCRFEIDIFFLFVQTSALMTRLDLPSLPFHNLLNFSFFFFAASVIQCLGTHPVILRRWGNVFLFLLLVERPDLRFDQCPNRWSYYVYFFPVALSIHCLDSQLRVCHKLTGKLKREVILGSSSLDDPAQFITVWTFFKFFKTVCYCGFNQQ